MHKFDPAFKNETHLIPSDFELQTDQIIPARRLDQVLINKKKKKLCIESTIEGNLK